MNALSFGKVKSMTGRQLLASIQNQVCMMTTDALASLYGDVENWPKGENPQYDFFRATQADGYFKVRLK